METWKKIEDYPGYEASNLGRVRSLLTDRIMRLQPNQNNQLTVCLYRNGKSKRMLVSRIIANLFIDNPNNYPVVMHKDDNTFNNLVDNLMWGTQQMNIDDMHAKGRSKRILTDDDVLAIKKLHPSYSYKQIADMYNVSKSAIAFILQKRRYNHLTI